MYPTLVILLVALKKSRFETPLSSPDALPTFQNINSSRSRCAMRRTNTGVDRPDKAHMRSPHSHSETFYNDSLDSRIIIEDEDEQ